MVNRINRVKMCQNKVSFTNKATAIAKAEKYNQNVYECPICFCWHCTSREDWKDEFVTVEKYQSLIQHHERLLIQFKEAKTYKKRVHEAETELFRVMNLIKRILKNDESQTIKEKSDEPQTN